MSKTKKVYVARVRDATRRLHQGKAFRITTRTNLAGQFGTRAWAEDAIKRALANNSDLVRVGISVEKINLVESKPKVSDWLLGNVVPIEDVPVVYRAQYRDTLERATAAAVEYGAPVWVNESFRTREQQEQFWAIYQAGGNLAAKPGTSPHEHGLALDIVNARTTPKLIKALRSRDLIDDVPSEIWHVTNHHRVA